MDGRTVARSAFLVFLAVSAVLPGIAAGQQAASTGAQSSVDPDTVVLQLYVQPDGTALWRVEYRVRLDDQNTTDAFESLRRDIESNTSAYRERFGSRMERTVAEAENTTGREMAVENVTVRATQKQLPQDYGVVTYRFTWTGFAATDGQTLTVGDALAGFFLDSETRLTIAWPGEYRATQVTPQPDEQGSQSVTWRGPTDFGGGEPSVSLTTASTAAGGGENGSGGLVDGLISDVGFTIGGILVLIAGAITLWRWRRGALPADADTTDHAEREAATSPRGENPPAELMSNEEQVLAVLDDHDGRVKQQKIVEELGWTDAKTSQVVRRLREEGKITGFRLGRENVLECPDDDT